MNSFELITKYLPQALDKHFVAESKTAVLEQGQKFIDVNFKESGYIKIASMLLDGLSDYYRTQTGINGGADYSAYEGNVGSGYRDGFAIGGADITWEIFKLQYCRGRQFRIDYIENEETAGVVIGNIIEQFNKLKVIPEVDATRFSIIADTCSASLGNLVTETPNASDIITKFNSAFEWLTECEVPDEEQIIFVSPAIMAIIRNSTELTRFITQGDFRSDAGLDFTVSKYMGRPIIEVPSSRFFTKISVGNNGYAPTAGVSTLINYMVVSKKAVIPIKKLEWSKIYDEQLSGLAGFHGYLINYLIYHGVVIPKNKVCGAFVSVSSAYATTKVNSLKIDTREGATQYSWKLNNFFTTPQGLRGYVVYSYTAAFTLGGLISSVGTLNTDYFIADLGVDQTATSSQTTAYFGLVDASGKIIATSGSVAVTLVRHA